MKKRNKLTPYQRTRLIALFCVLLSAVIAGGVQIKGQSEVGDGCSYLDPVTIDILAFAVAIFLVIEGFYRLSEHKNMSVKNQFTRIIRISVGTAIIAIHSLQFLHKFVHY